MSSHHTILGTLQSVSELCHLVSERPVPYGCGHVPSVPVTSAAQPFGDGSVSSPPDSRQTVPEKAWGKCRRSNGSSAAGVAHAAYTGEGCPLRVLGLRGSLLRLSPVKAPAQVHTPVSEPQP